MSTQSKIRSAVTVGCIATCGFVALAAFVAPHSVSSDVVFAFVVFGVLAVAATNLDVIARASIGMSGSVMIFMAAVVVFGEYSFFLGPALIGLLCGLFDVVHLRKREWDKIAFNCASDALSLMGGTAAFFLIAADKPVENPFILTVAVAAAACTYLLLNAVFVSFPVAISSGDEYRRVLREILAFNVGAFPFALLGLGLGWVYLELGAAVVPLLVVPILIARSTFASYLELKAGQEQTIETLIPALEATDPYTAGHAQRVATFSEYVGAELAFGQRRMERLRYAALMHDIGKLVGPNQILNKPGRLTEAEFERVKRHETVSVELLHRIDFLAPVAGDTTTEAATAAVDGTDLIEPAIIHVADAFDAMTSTRSYRRALSQETAFTELRDGAGTQFNAVCVEALIHSIERRGEQYGAGHEVDEHEWAVAPPEAGTGSAGLGHLVRDEPVPEEQAAGS
jgi:HD-GYP domain-containing protein (c-di-GMP phosphodiesterase class II)